MNCTYVYVNERLVQGYWHTDIMLIMGPGNIFRFDGNLI